MGKWLITDRVHPNAKTGLEAMGFQVDWMPDISNEHVYEIIDDYYGLIISTKTTIHRALVDKANSLKVIGRVGIGMDHIDMDYCAQKGIICLNAPGGNSNAVAEHVIGMLIGLSKNIGKAHREMLKGKWERFGNNGFEIKGKTIGIIGFGRTGSCLARKLKGFDCKILAHDKYLNDFGDNTIIECDLERIKAEADVISFHVPLTNETKHWINDEFIKSCQKKPVIINTSRGAIAKTNDLLTALQRDKIRGLCLDVFEDEPITIGNVNEADLYKLLLSFPNVIATPHIAGWSVEAKENMVNILLSRIRGALNK